MASNLCDNDVLIFSKTGGNVIIAKSLLFENSPIIKSKIENSIIIPPNVLMLKENWKCLFLLKRFLETKTIDIKSMEDAFEIYIMSADYKIKNLLRYCRCIIANGINTCNLHHVFYFAYEEKDKIIEYYCWKKFDDECDEVLQTSEFFTCDAHIIDIILSRPKYKTLKEITLFEFLINWASRKFLRKRHFTNTGSNSYDRIVRHYLSPFFNKIRFLSMSSEELEIVFSYNILSEQEKQSIVSYRKNSFGTLPTTICGINIKRTSHCYSLLIKYKNRHLSVDRHKRYLMANDNLLCLFSPEEDCFLCEIILPIFHEKNGIIVTIKIGRAEIVLHEEEYITTANIVSLNDPIFLQKNVEYTVIAAVNFEKNKFPINLSPDVEFYIEDQDYAQLHDRLNKFNWNKYCINIKLYF